MLGKDCVAIACDLRLGMKSLTIANNYPKIFCYGDTYLGITGLAADIETVYVFVFLQEKSHSSIPIT